MPSSKPAGEAFDSHGGLTAANAAASFASLVAGMTFYNTATAGTTSYNVVHDNGRKNAAIVLIMYL